VQQVFDQRFAGMSNVDDNVEVVHLLHGFFAKSSQTTYAKEKTKRNAKEETERLKNRRSRLDVKEQKKGPRLTP
jgi:hypothetical protein